MTQVDFYILPSAELSARLMFACKLTEKAWRLGHRIYLYCQDEVQCQALDQSLWQFRAEAFVAHTLSHDNPEDAAVVIGHSEPPASHADLLINLSTEIPAFAARFRRIAEVVIEEPASRQAAREHFRFYREQGYALQDHRLSRV